MNTTVRKLADGDNLSIVSNLIYETDNYIFPHFFKESKNLAIEILPHMIELDTIYNRNNIHVGLLNDKLVGIMVIVESPIKINVCAYIEAFQRAEALIDSDFERVLKEYYIPLEAEPEGYFIANVCVDENYRGYGIGGAMLETVLAGLDPDKDVYLDCLANNETALAVYEAHGFEPLFKYSGFTGLPYYKMIRRADRDVD